MVALVLMAGARYSWRLVLEHRRRSNGEGSDRVLIFGAGDGAPQVIPTLLHDPSNTYLPIGLIDDDPANRKFRILGVPVLGNRSRLNEIAAQSKADALLIAAPSAGLGLSPT